MQKNLIVLTTRHNNLVLHMRMCDAWLGSIDLALQKARGSAFFPMPTSRYWPLTAKALNC